MSEISQALHQLADRVEADPTFQPVEFAIAMSDNQGRMRATYVGRKSPVRDALIYLLARGIEQSVVSQDIVTQPAVVAAGLGAPNQ